jgi:hypothetical protein
MAYKEKSQKGMLQSTVKNPNSKSLLPSKNGANSKGLPGKNSK